MTPVDAPSAPASGGAATAADQFFGGHRYEPDLRRKSIHGAATTLLGQVSKVVLRLGSTAVLARLLTPEDYGLIAMTTVVTGFAGLFKDAGLTQATIQRQHIRHDQVSTLFWINVALGCVISLVLAAISPLVAMLFREPRLSAVTSLIGLTFALSGLVVQHQALLRRQMRFTLLAGIEILAMAGGIAMAVGLAYAGFRHWSLVALNVGAVLINVVAVWIAVPWWPGKPRRGTGVMPMLRFGSDVLTFNIVNYFSRHADNLLIGWYWGPVPLGLYEKAYSLLMLPITQFNGPMAAVAVPTLSRAGVEPARFRRFFVSALRAIAGAGVPVVLGLSLFAEELIAVWLGPQWAASARLFRLLSVAALSSALSNPMGWMLISAGLTRRYRTLGFLTAPLIVASFALGLPYGAEGVAIAYSSVMIVVTVPAWWWAVQGTPVSMRDIGGAVLPALAAGAVAYAGTLLAMVFTPAAWSALERLVVGGVLFGTVYAAVLLVVFRQWHFYAGLVRELAPRPPSDVGPSPGDLPKAELGA